MAPWRPEALKRRYASSMALPLMCRGEAFGALALYAEEPDPFDESTFEQYTDLTNNLAYGVRLSDAKFIDANDAFVRWFGLEREKILGHDSRELGISVNPDDREKFLSDLRRNGS